jgi:rare lipoprotein A (peptidoglycan hydrolase)
MRLRRAIGLSLVLLVVSAAAIAKQAHAAQHQPAAGAKDKQVKAAVSKKDAKLKGLTERRAKTEASKSKGAKADIAKNKHANLQVPLARSDVTTRGTTNRHASTNDRSERPSTGSSAPDQYIPSYQVLGTHETGSAAWYGPRHIGHRTASGDRLDTVSPTAAHRSLPLNSLARVTNLKNGRSIVVKVTDRGPWGGNRLIDVSPKAAEELDMKRAGIVRVKVEPVVVVKPKPQLASGTAGATN